MMVRADLVLEVSPLPEATLLSAVEPPPSLYFHLLNAAQHPAPHAPTPASSDQAGAAEAGWREQHAHDRPEWGSRAAV